MCASSSARGCVPMPFSGGPTSLLPRSPELVAARAGAGEERSALRGVAGLLDLGQQRRDDVGLASCAAGASESSSAAASAATCRSGCVRSRATLAGPRLRRRDLPVLHRGQQRQRGRRPLEELIEDRRRVGARQRRDQHGIDIRAGARRRARRSSRPCSAGGVAGSDSIGAIVASASARRAGTASRLPALSMRRVVARGGVAQARASISARVAVGLRAQRAGLVPLRHDRQRHRPSSPDRRAASAAPAWSGRRAQPRPPSIRATARTMVALSGAASGPARGSRDQQARRVVGQRRGQRRRRRSRSAPPDARSRAPRVT